MNFEEIQKQGIEIPNLETLNYTHIALNISCSDIIIYVFFIEYRNNHFNSKVVTHLPMKELNIERNTICYFNFTDPEVQMHLTPHMNQNKGLQKKKDWYFLPIEYLVKGTKG